MISLIRSFNHGNRPTDTELSYLDHVAGPGLRSLYLHYCHHIYDHYGVTRIASIPSQA
jgi:hypothetical protein